MAGSVRLTALLRSASTAAIPSPAVWQRTGRHPGGLRRYPQRLCRHLQLGPPRRRDSHGGGLRWEREFALSTFEVKTLGEEFVVGLDGECTIPNFPLMDETTTVEWNTSTQSFVLAKIVEITPDYEPYAPLLSQVSRTGPLFATAKEDVDISALEEAGNMLSVMLGERPDLSDILRSAGALTAVISRNENPCDLPYFSDL